jgi:hypothetical protein
MQVAEVLDLDTYFRDGRFARKKPNLRGTWQERCGDNFYSRGPNGEWIRHRNRFHLDDAIQKQDTKFARVFIGKRFGYFGQSAQNAPPQFAALFGGRGARVNHDPAIQAAFIAWAESNLPQGIHGDPNDNPDA